MDVRDNKHPLRLGRSHQEIIWDSVKYINGKDVLVLGAGEGRSVSFLARRGFAVTGVDKSERLLNALQAVLENRGLSANLINCLIENFSFDKRYNAVFSLNSLHFLKREDIARVIRLMKDNTSIGGINAIRVFTLMDPDHNYTDEITYFQSGELKSYYQDWEIIHYDEYQTRLEKHNNGEWHRHHVAEIIARKKGWVF